MTHTLKAHGFHPENNSAFLSRYFGEGMARLWNNEQAKVRQLCEERSPVNLVNLVNPINPALDWDAMSEQARGDFIDDIVHEDCACSY